VSNIKTLANFAPPATEDEIRASALQFVRRLSHEQPVARQRSRVSTSRRGGTAAAERLIRSLTTTALPRNREEEARKARERAQERFA
jgi:hypothetical protein